MSSGKPGRKIKQGSVVTVFNSPVEFDEPIGNGTLIRRIDKLEKNSLLQKWRIRMIDTGKVVSKCIWLGDKIKEEKTRWKENADKRSWRNHSYV